MVDRSNHSTGFLLPKIEKALETESKSFHHVKLSMRYVMQTYNNTTKKESLLRLIPLKNKHHCYQVELSLPTETRYIGKIDMGGDGGTFFTKRRNENIFRKIGLEGSIGINFALLHNPNIKFKWIIVELDGRSLVTSREFVKTYGKQYQFSQKDFELQVFLPIEDFDVNRARAFERVRGIQDDFFTKRKAV